MSTKNASTRSTSRTPLYTLVGMLGFAGLFSVAQNGLPALLAVSYEDTVVAATSSPLAAVVAEVQKQEEVLHVATPKPLKAIYMSQCAVGTPSLRNDLVKLVEDTELNAIVIDIKDYTGKIAFPTDNEKLAGSVSEACGARDMRSFVKRLHESGIYVIGRITVFQDPYYTSEHPELAVQSSKGGVWEDNKGLAFVDVGSRPFWDYIVELGKISYELGFDELNFDYVRYPSDGPMSEAVFTQSGTYSKPEMLEQFFLYLSNELRPTGAVLSADLFGMTATVESDMNIGQVLERAIPYFDGVYPMVYPSHYPSGFNGYSNANEHSYDIVNYAMETAVARVLATTTRIDALAYERIGTSTPARYAKPAYDKYLLRPWLQSFDYPVHYTPEMVAEQIKATYDAGLDSWLFWDAANKYTSLRAVLLPE